MIIFVLISFIFLLISLLKKYRYLSLLNIFNTFITWGYLYLFFNVLENRFNDSFIDNVIVTDKFYSYLGLYHIVTIIFMFVIQVWTINIWYLFFNNYRKDKFIKK